MWKSFALLKLDLILDNNTGKQRLNFVYRKKTPSAVQRRGALREE